MLQWFALYFEDYLWINVILGSVWHHDWHHNKVGHLDLYFMVQWFWPYILNVNGCMNIIIWDYELVWSNSWPKSKCRSLWPIFHSPVILCCIFKATWCMTIIVWDYYTPGIWSMLKGYIVFICSVSPFICPSVHPSICLAVIPSVNLLHNQVLLLSVLITCKSATTDKKRFIFGMGVWTPGSCPRAGLEVKI